MHVSDTGTSINMEVSKMSKLKTLKSLYHTNVQTVQGKVIQPYTCLY